MILNQQNKSSERLKYLLDLHFLHNNTFTQRKEKGEILA